MKWLGGIVISLFIGLFLGLPIFLVRLANQRETEDREKVENLLGGEHKLRKMTERVEQNSTISGGFFLIAGSLNGKNETITTVKFAWEMNDGAYAISSLPLEKIRVKFNNNIEIPTIYFQTGDAPDYYDELQRTLDVSIICAVITCKESDWPAQVQLPLNK